MCANTCHPPDGPPNTAAVPDWAREDPLTGLPGEVAAVTGRDGLPAPPAGTPWTDAVAGPPVGDAQARALALAVCVDVLLAELVAERRRRRAVVDRYEHLLDCRGRGGSGTAGRADGGALERLREWIGD